MKMRTKFILFLTWDIIQYSLLMYSIHIGHYATVLYIIVSLFAVHFIANRITAYLNSRINAELDHFDKQLKGWMESQVNIKQ